MRGIGNGTLMTKWMTQQEIEGHPGLGDEQRSALVCARELGACVALEASPPTCEISYRDETWTASGDTLEEAAAQALARFDAVMAESG